MTVEMIVAPPAAGKTEACIQKIVQVLQESPLAPVWVIVPGRLQTAAFRRRLATSGGTLGVYVGTFKDLYLHIIQTSGIFIPVASSALLFRLLQMTVDEAVHENEIPHFLPIHKTSGFILTLRDIFAELNRALVSPEKLLEFSSSGTPAQKELALLFAKYQQRLHHLNWIDPEGLSSRAIDILQSHQHISLSIKMLVVDGFDTFTPAQRRALELLSGRVDEIMVTLPGGLNSTRSAHRRFLGDIQSLMYALSPRLITSGKTPVLPEDILFIEQNIFEPAPTSPRRSTSTLLLEARSPREEVREALRWIKTRVIRDGLSLHECAIFVPDPAVYHPLLALTAAEFGVPLHFTRGRPLKESPLIVALLNLLTLQAQNYPVRQLFTALRSPYFNVRIEVSAIDALENISRVARILQGRDQWDETWEELVQAEKQELPDLEEDYPLSKLPQGGEATILRDALQGFFIRISVDDQPRSYAEWVGWLEDMLDDLELSTRADGESDQLAMASFRQALRSLVLSEAVIGNISAGYNQFLSDLQGALDGVGIFEPVMKDTATLVIAKMSEAAGVRHKAVVLLGLSEGIFPQMEREDPFLDEKMRLQLGLESRLEREQAGLFYQAVCSTDHYLLITRPYLSDDGEDWEPSPYWNSVKSLFTGECVERIRPDDPRLLIDAASSHEVLFWGVKGKNLPSEFADLQPRWKNVLKVSQIMQARLEKQPVSRFEGDLQSLDLGLVLRYSAEKKWSASRLESYAACPYMFFTAQTLDLSAISEPETGLDASQSGSMLHKILEEAYRNAANPADADSVLAVLPDVVRRVFAYAPRQYGFRPSPLWEIEKNQFVQDVENTIRELALLGTGWIPFKYEQCFGREGISPLQVDLEGEIVLFQGIIDRLDHDGNGGIRVIDYKSGGSHLGLQDLLNGRRLQLPLYALAARDVLQLGEPKVGLYWQIRSAKVGALTLGDGSSETAISLDEATEIVKKHLTQIINNIRAGIFIPRPPSGGCPSYCPAVLWCWRYKAGW